MHKQNECLKIIALLLSAVMILEIPGCYSLRAISKEEIQYANRKLYFIHGQNTSFNISNVSITNGVLSGRMDNFLSEPKREQIHIYVAPDSAIEIMGVTVNIPFRNIAKVEVFKVDGGKTATLMLGTAYSALFVVVLIMILTKGVSCPFVYSDDGSNMTFEGEIYSGATALPLERDDYLRLNSIRPVDDLYKVKLTNEVNEIQNTNLAELLVLDHPAGTDLFVDKYGIAHTVSNLTKPFSADNAYGKSLTRELSCRDTLRYISELRDDPVLKDTISLTFEKPVGVKSSKLVISGKNTMWLDYIFGRFTDFFGRRYDNWKEKRNKKPGEELFQWEFDQGFPLAVYLETDSGLKFMDYFNLPGPMADKDDILCLDLSEVSGTKVNLKLVAGLLFWDLDFAAMDFSDDQSVNKTVVPAASAIDEKERDVTPLLNRIDDKYLVQPDGNNATSLTFIVPPALPGRERTIFFHSRGNYEILREAHGKPDIARLKTFLEPGSFIRFSKDHILKYYQNSN